MCCMNMPLGPALEHNPSIERTGLGKPSPAAHVER